MKEVYKLIGVILILNILIFSYGKIQKKNEEKVSRFLQEGEEAFKEVFVNENNESVEIEIGENKEKIKFNFSDKKCLKGENEEVECSYDEDQLSLTIKNNEKSFLIQIYKYSLNVDECQGTAVLTISFYTAQNSFIKLNDLEKTYQGNNGIFSIDLEPLEKGTYQIKILRDEEELIVQDAIITITQDNPLVSFSPLSLTLQNDNPEITITKKEDISNIQLKEGSTTISLNCKEKENQNNELICTFDSSLIIAESQYSLFCTKKNCKRVWTIPKTITIKPYLYQLSSVPFVVHNKNTIESVSFDIKILSDGVNDSNKHTFISNIQDQTITYSCDDIVGKKMKCTGTPSSPLNLPMILPIHYQEKSDKLIYVSLVQYANYSLNSQCPIKVSGQGSQKELQIKVSSLKELDFFLNQEEITSSSIISFTSPSGNNKNYEYLIKYSNKTLLEGAYTVYVQLKKDEATKIKLTNIKSLPVRTLSEVSNTDAIENKPDQQLTFVFQEKLLDWEVIRIKLKSSGSAIQEISSSSCTLGTKIITEEKEVSTLTCIFNLEETNLKNYFNVYYDSACETNIDLNFKIVLGKIVSDYSIDVVIQSSYTVGKKDIVVTLVYNDDFVENDIPKISLVNSSDGTALSGKFYKLTPVENIEKQTNKYSFSIPPSDQKEGKFKIKSIFKDPFNDFVSNADQIIEIKKLKFFFSQLYFIKASENDKFTLTITIGNNEHKEVSSIKIVQGKELNKVDSETYSIELTEKGKYNFVYLDQSQEENKIEKTVIIGESFEEISPIEISECLFYTDQYVVTLTNPLPDIVISLINEETQTVLTSLVTSDSLTYTIDSSKVSSYFLKGKKFILQIKESGQTTILYNKPAVFTQISYSASTDDDSAFLNTPLIFSTICKLEPLELQMTIDQKSKALNCQYEEGSLTNVVCSIPDDKTFVGESEIKLGDNLVKTLTVYPSILTSKFEILLPDVKNEEGSKKITISSEEFPITEINKVILSRDGTEVTFAKGGEGFAVDGKTLFVVFTYKAREHWEVVGMLRNQINNKDTEKLAFYTPQQKLIMDSNRFTIEEEYFFLNKLKSKVYQIEIKLKLLNDLKADDYKKKIFIDDNAIKCTKESENELKCQHSETQSKKISLYIEGEKNSAVDAYIFLYYSSSSTMCFSFSGVEPSTELLKYNFEIPIVISTIRFTLNFYGQELNAPVYADGVLSYTLYDKDQLDKTLGIKCILNKKTYTLDDEFEFYPRYKVVSISNHLLEGQAKDEVDITVTFKNDTESKPDLPEDIIFYLTSVNLKSPVEPIEVKKKENEKNILTLTFKTTEISSGEYKIQYEDGCGHLIDGEYKIMVISIKDNYAVSIPYYYTLTGDPYTISVLYTLTDIPFTFEFVKADSDSKKIEFSQKDTEENNKEYSHTFTEEEEGTYILRFGRRILEEHFIIVGKTYEYLLEIDQLPPQCSLVPKEFSLKLTNKFSDYISLSKFKLFLTGESYATELVCERFTQDSKESATCKIPNDIIKTLQVGKYLLKIYEISSYYLLVYPITYSSINELDEHYYKSDLSFEGALCLLPKITLKSEKSEKELEIQCSKYEESSHILSCDLPEDFSDFGVYSVTIENKDFGSTHISNDIAASTFEIRNPPTIAIGKNTYYITSPDFYLPTLSAIVIETKSDQINLNEKNFSYNYEDLLISFEINIEKEKEYSIKRLERAKKRETDTDFKVEMEHSLSDPGKAVASSEVLFDSFFVDAAEPEPIIIIITFSLSSDATRVKDRVEVNNVNIKESCSLAELKLTCLYNIKTPKTLRLKLDNDAQTIQSLYVSTYNLTAVTCNEQTDVTFNLNHPKNYISYKVSSGDSIINVGKSEELEDYISTPYKFVLSDKEITIEKDGHLPVEIPITVRDLDAIDVTSVESSVYVMKDNQEATLVFNNKVTEEEIQNIYLVNSVDLNETISPKSCELIENKKFKCIFDFSDYEDERDYIVKYTNPCGTIKTAGIVKLQESKYLIDEISPQLFDLSKDQKVTVTFKKPLTEKPSRVQLLHNKTNEIEDELEIEMTENSNSCTFLVPAKTVTSNTNCRLYFIYDDDESKNFKGKSKNILILTLAVPTFKFSRLYYVFKDDADKNPQKVEITVNDPNQYVYDVLKEDETPLEKDKEKFVSKIESVGEFSFKYRIIQGGVITIEQKVKVVDDGSKLVSIEGRTCNYYTTDLTLKVTYMNNIDSSRIKVMAQTANTTFVSLSSTDKINFTFKSASYSSVQGQAIKFIVVEGGYTSYPLSEIEVTFTGINVSKEYSFKGSSITLSSICDLTYLSFSLIAHTGTVTQLQCKYVSLSISCEHDETEGFGEYTIWTDEIEVGSLFISNTIEKSTFIILNPPTINYGEPNTYYISSIDYYLPLISSICINKDDSHDCLSNIYLTNESTSQISFEVELENNSKYILKSLTGTENQVDKTKEIGQDLTVKGNSIEFQLDQEYFFIEKTKIDQDIEIKLIPINEGDEEFEKASVFGNGKILSDCQKSTEEIICKFKPTKPMALVISLNNDPNSQKVAIISLYTSSGKICPTTTSLVFTISYPISVTFTITFSDTSGEEQRLTTTSSYKEIQYTFKTDLLSNQVHALQISNGEFKVFITELNLVQISSNSLKTVSGTLFEYQTNQKLAILFKDPIDTELIDISSFYIGSASGNCQINEQNSSQLDCVFNLSSISANSYELSFTDKCSTRIKQVTVYSYPQCTKPNVVEIPENGVPGCVSCKDPLPLYYSGKCVSSCPEGQEVKDGVCSCGESKVDQEGKCVDSCTGAYGIYKDETVCTKCSSIQFNGNGSYKVDNGKCVLKLACASAMVQINGECFWPEETSEPCKYFNCGENGSCSSLNGNPICTCTNNYTGILCDIGNEEAKQKTKDILTTMTSEKITAAVVNKDETTISNMINVLSIYNNDPSVLSSFAQQDTSTIQTIVDSTSSAFSETLTEMEEQTENKEAPTKPLMNALSFSMMLQLTKIKQSSTSSSSDKDKLGALVSLAHRLNKLFIRNGSSGTFTDYSNLMKFQIEKLSDSTRRLGEEISNSIDFSGCSASADYYLVSSSFPSSINSNTKKSGIASGSITFTVLDLEGNDKTEEFLKSCSSQITLGLSVPDDFNVNLFNEYMIRGINIYNKTDKGYDTCFISENFDFDLTERYRKENIFQELLIVPPDNCVYSSIEVNSGVAFFKCSSIKTSTNLGFSLEADSIVTSSYPNPVLKCSKVIKELGKNTAFIFYLTFTAALVVGYILLFSIILHKKGDTINDKAVKNDGLNLTAGKTEKELSAADVGIEFDSLGQTIYHNFKMYHPLFYLCSPSLLTPIFIALGLWVFEIFSIFGFNALLFSETMIEKRIFNQDRDSFIYPLKEESSKIFGSIFATAAVLLLIKLISLTTIEGRGNISETSINEYYKKMLIRWCVIGAIMLGFSVFLFYYSVIFCGVYVNAKIGWLFSGIWSLIFSWCCFGPLYLVMISILENWGVYGLTYYMKRLFFF